MNLRALPLTVFAVSCFLSCKEPELTSPYDVPADTFALPPGVMRADTAVVPYLPERSNNVVYLGEPRFVLQIVLYNLPSQTFAGSFEVQVPSNIKIESIVPNERYFDTTKTNMISIPIIADSTTAQYAVSYIKGSLPKTPPNGVLFNLVCIPLHEGDGFVRFVGEQLVLKTGSNVPISSQVSRQQVKIKCDSLRIVVKEGFAL
jgi:hypothetical protein